jgi:hypothetical protein
MVIDLSNRIKNIKVRKILPFAIISAIGVFGLVSTTMLLTRLPLRQLFSSLKEGMKVYVYLR